MTVTVQAGALKERLEGITRDMVSPKLLLRIGAFVKFRIDERTARGVDVEGSAFRPYSPRYKLFRKKEGHPTSKVNLFFSGSMLSALTFSAKGDVAKVFFLPSQDPSGTSNPLKAFYLNKTRRFFAMSAEDIDLITRMVNKHIQKLLEG
jgi:hypothetical protein